MARLIVLAGLPGTGKSSIARELARRTGAVWLRVDSMDRAIWASGTAPPDLRDWTYRAAQAVATDNLGLGRDVIADCVNDCREVRDGWGETGRSVGVQVVWLEIVCSDLNEHRRRVQTRAPDVARLLLPDWEAVASRDFHPWDRDHITIDTSGQTLEMSVEAVMAAVAS